MNGHIIALKPQFAPPDPDVMARIEAALAQMVIALAGLGFSEYEAGMVNLSTRVAITDVAKQRRESST